MNIESTRHLAKSRDSLDLAVQDLRGALKTATAVEALVLMPLIEQAAVLLRGIEALQSAAGSTD